MRLKGLTVVDLRRDSAMPESELSPLRSLLRRLTAVLIGLSVLCLAGCASSRKATSSHSEQLKVDFPLRAVELNLLSQESEQVRAESFELARDTLIEVLGRAKRQSRVLL